MQVVPTEQRQSGPATSLLSDKGLHLQLQQKAGGEKQVIDLLIHLREKLS